MSDENDKDDIKVSGEQRPERVPDGTYEVAYVKRSKALYRGAWKLYVWFKVCTPGPHMGAILYRAYNLYEPLKPGSDLFKDLERIAGKRLKRSASLKHFANRILTVSTRTVLKDNKQVAKAEHEQYSVIDKIIRAETKGEL